MASIYGEVPTGAVNSTNTVFTTSLPYVTGSTRVFVAGSRKQLGVAYTESAPSTLTFATAPTTGQVVELDYDVVGGGTWNTWTTYPTGETDFNGTVSFPAGTDLASGMGVVVFGPKGAQANFPAVNEGPPGLPALIDSASASTLSPGSSVTVGLTQVSPGSSGANSHYTLAFGIPRGDTGASGAFALAAATDLSGTAAVGKVPVVTGTGPTAFTLQAQKVGDCYTTSVSSVTSVTGNQTLSSQTIPAQPFDWRPVVKGGGTVTGAAAGVQVDLAVTLNTTGGTVVGYGYGNPGVGPAWVALDPNNVGASVSASKINAGSAATFYLRALQIDSTGSAYSVVGSRSDWTIEVHPIP